MSFLGVVYRLHKAKAMVDRPMASRMGFGGRRAKRGRSHGREDELQGCKADRGSVLERRTERQDVQEKLIYRA